MDTHAFQNNAINKAISEDNVYNFNNSEASLARESSKFVNKKPYGAFYSATMADRLARDQEAEARQRAKRIRDNPEELEVLPVNHWNPHGDQPPYHCFNCKHRFNPMVRQPWLMPCGHKVCRECVISAENRNEPVVCFFDNSNAKGLTKFSQDLFLTNELEKQAKAKLDELY